MKLAAIVGSISKNSINMQIAKIMKKEFKDLVDIDILKLDDIPMFSVDIEDNPPSIINDHIGKIQASDGLIIITPEYNYSIPGVLKNTLDWLSRVDSGMEDKPTLILGASPGRFGTVKAQMHLRQILDVPNLNPSIMPGGDICLSGVNETLDNGHIIDEDTISYLKSKIEEFIEFSK